MRAAARLVQHGASQARVAAPILPVMRRRRTVLAVVLGLVLAAGIGGAGAGQKDPRLDRLFDTLRATAEPAEAQAVEVQIWRIWGEAGDAATDTLMQLGTAAMQSGDLAGALSLFDAVTARKPDFAEGWNKRATVLFLMGAMEKSAEDVARVLALEPRHFGALSGLGLINTRLDRADAAIAAFEQALKVNPHMPGAKANLDALRKKRGKGAI
jgi:tetratricopeptide (TPR) repeat protein